MNLVCEYCDKVYVSKSSLQYHQKTSKVCLKIKEKQDKIRTQLTTIFTKCIDDEIDISSECQTNLASNLEYCNKLIDIYEDEIQEYKQKINEYKKHIETYSKYEKLVNEIKNEVPIK